MPKQGRDIGEIAKWILEQQEKKEDLIVPDKAIEMIPLDDKDNPVIIKTDRDNLSLVPTKTAHSQIATKLKVPFKYYERMLNEQPQLLADNVNTWFQESEDDRMVRTYKGDPETQENGVMRAYLSDKYFRFDYDNVAEASLPVIAEKQLNIVSSEITEKKLYIKAVSDRLTADVKQGDSVRCGIIISDSEVGFGSVKVQSYVERLVCMNGMIAGDVFNRRHIGVQQGVAQFLTTNTMNKTGEALMGQIKDTIAGVLSEDGFTNIVNKLRDSSGIQVAKPEKAVEVLQKQFSFTDNEKESVLSHLVTGGDLSQWGLANAVTRASQDIESYDRATEFESFGWDTVNLSQSQLEPVLA